VVLARRELVFVASAASPPPLASVPSPSLSYSGLAVRGTGWIIGSPGRTTALTYYVALLRGCRPRGRMTTPASFSARRTVLVATPNCAASRSADRPSA